MSTFDGNIAEFPEIRVDSFRRYPNLRPPLACFLSHIHSDHLAGLDSLHSPFVYCSAATKQLLLRLERYPCRINYAKGILEARVQTYKHLESLLKPIPLETPTTLELEPGNHLQVTLFSANHCPGVVMFLFEGQGKAALYTGDIRSEPWFVNSLIRNPCLLQYACGLQALDTIYLDTSFIRRDVKFQTKADGIRELLQKVSRYPPDTIFHLQAWTYGYEDVWIALSKFLNSKIHVDEYKMRVYKSLIARDSSSRHNAESYLSPEAPGLVGFICGNAEQPGCLTADENVRLHSCEKGNFCSLVQTAPVVWIKPVVAHLPSGQDVDEVGIGGGGGDLEREAELDSLSPEDIRHLLDAASGVDDASGGLEKNIRDMLLNVANRGQSSSLKLDLSAFGDENKAALADALQALNRNPKVRGEYPDPKEALDSATLPDVWPCTVDRDKWARNGTSIQKLFGAHCSGTEFRHDIGMGTPPSVFNSVGAECDSQESDVSSGVSFVLRGIVSGSSILPHPPIFSSLQERGDDHGWRSHSSCDSADNTHETPRGSFSTLIVASREKSIDEKELLEEDSQCSTISRSADGMRELAFQTMLGNLGGHDWRPIELISVSDNHTTPDADLGER